MKKGIIWAVFAVMLWLVSCQNEDITMQRKVSFKIDPSGVVDGFTYEAEEDELEALAAGYQLRIRLLVYDEAGSLKAENTEYVAGYQSILTLSLALADGTYTAVALTDVVKIDAGETTSGWNVAETSRLYNLKITDAKALDGKYKILGVSDYRFEVREGVVDHTLRVQPAGALLCVEATNIHFYNTAWRYQLGMTKGSEGIIFNGDGSQSLSVEDYGDSFAQSPGHFDPREHVGSDECHFYAFVLPLGRTTFQWIAKTTSDASLYVGEKMTANIRKGEEYLVRFELGSEIVTHISLVGEAAE